MSTCSTTTTALQLELEQALAATPWDGTAVDRARAKLAVARDAERYLHRTLPALTVCCHVLIIHGVCPPPAQLRIAGGPGLGTV